MNHTHIFKVESERRKKKTRAERRIQKLLLLLPFSLHVLYINRLKFKEASFFLVWILRKVPAGLHEDVMLNFSGANVTSAGRRSWVRLPQTLFKKQGSFSLYQIPFWLDKYFLLLWPRPTDVTAAAAIVLIHGQIPAIPPRLLWLWSFFLHALSFS